MCQQSKSVTQHHTGVEKDGKFGPFLACPGFPECTFTMPLVVVMPGSCPKCGGRLMKRTGVSKKSGKQYTYYCCEYRSHKDESEKCEFVTWDVPVKDDCPVCGKTMFKRSGKGFKKPFCINEACANFLPEDKRGYPKTAAQDGEQTAEGAEGEKKPGRKKKAESEKKPTTKKTAKTTAKKTAEKKPAEKKTAKKTAEKKPAEKKTAKSASAKKAAKTVKEGEE